MDIKKFQKIQPKKTWIVLAVALGAGALAALVASSYLSNRLADVDARGKQQTTSIVVAKVALKAGEPLNMDNVASRDLPTQYVHAGVIKPGEFTPLVGRSLSVDVQPGEPLLWGLIEGRKVATFGGQVSPGRRAITIEVDAINSISGLLEPGDSIDLILNAPVKAKGAEGKSVTLTIMQGLRVLATDQRAMGDAKNAKAEFDTVTLDVEPAEATTLVAARSTGKLTAVLRNPTDPAPARRMPVPWDTVMAMITGLPEAPIKEIPVLVGPSMNLPQYKTSLNAPAKPREQVDREAAITADLQAAQSAFAKDAQALKEAAKEKTQTAADVKPDKAQP